MEQQKLRFPSKAENIALVEKLVDEVCSEYKVNEDFYGNILVALTEAVNNAIYHGNKANPQKQVELVFEPDEKELLFVVQDEGPGFNFNNLPDPTDPANLEKENGRGIFLMRHLADSVEFEDCGKKVKLKFRLSAN